MELKRYLVVFVLMLFCAGSAVAGDDKTSDLDQLVEWMSGNFSSAAQAEADEDFYDIRLRMCPVWTDRTDAHWLYVEQAVATSQDQPYRQRVYRVRQLDENLFESTVYSLPEPEAVIGAWQEEEPLAGLSPEDLEERDGCSILMRRRGESYAGSTLGRLCTSTLRGATHATSEVEISSCRVVSWDRGFDADGNQVWGAVKGGYSFDRVDKEAGGEEQPATEAAAEPPEAEAVEEGAAEPSEEQG